MALTVTALHAHYGKSHVLRGVSFELPSQSIFSLVGRNGSGRSTTLKSILGIVPPTEGSIVLDGVEQAGRETRNIVRAGIAYVPEDRLVFPTLTVAENLRMGQLRAPPGRVAWTVDQMYDYFPRLHERRDTKAGKLSGGEQQMLTMCRSLLGNPKVLLLDEPTEGLAPKIVERLVEAILDIRKHGVSVLLIEQRLTIALDISDRILVMGHGHIVYDGTPDSLRENAEIQRNWLAVSGPAS
ncbi:ATP-binding cassette domain-containing protein [Bradyrhizobium pachyrhizi]|uniref:ATP-binding cassette domain-containing protein n=1 Tax=Bradyrhizobium pachyrhizi TaxID=280333 RepID=A0A844SFX5_9BRAD|nr:ABC transporter ATP-binding protein [Bradyrhizobium pachyrhizi]MVT66103.1 ATP-binding cassette domain-containing protein [Bradyrhizobium pachyrhizi]